MFLGLWATHSTVQTWHTWCPALRPPLSSLSHIKFTVACAISPLYCVCNMPPTIGHAPLVHTSYSSCSIVFSYGKVSLYMKEDMFFDALPLQHFSENAFTRLFPEVLTYLLLSSLLLSTCMVKFACLKHFFTFLDLFPRFPSPSLLSSNIFLSSLVIVMAPHRQANAIGNCTAVQLEGDVVTSEHYWPCKLALDMWAVEQRGERTGTHNRRFWHASRTGMIRAITFRCFAGEKIHTLSHINLHSKFQCYSINEPIRQHH